MALLNGYCAIVATCCLVSPVVCFPNYRSWSRIFLGLKFMSAYKSSDNRCQCATSTDDVCTRLKALIVSPTVSTISTSYGNSPKNEGSYKTNGALKVWEMICKATQD
jgi:hypothetical protein